jgi:type VI secretion system protein ImpL
MTIHLQHMAGSKKDEVTTFTGDRIRIGRNPDNDLVFDGDTDRQVGRYHAEIYRDGDRYLLNDLQSRNGTFLVGRRIDRPTALSDGDVVQFAPEGPTVRFSTRPLGATVVSPPSGEAPHAAASPEAPGSPRRMIVLGSALAIALTISAAIGYYWSSWWYFVAGVVSTAALGAVGLLSWNWWRARRERAATVRAADQATDRNAPETDSQRELLKRWTEGIDILRSSNLQQRGEDAIYALPWFMLLGEHGSGRSATVRAAGPLPSSTAAHRGATATRTCDWWFFEKCVVLDVTGRYVTQADERADGREWRKLLGLLKRTRRRMPLNGVIASIRADSLSARSTEQLQEQAGRVRRRLDEMVRELGVTFPVYLLVTNLDAVAGFSDFFGRLPTAAYDQAMGAIKDDVTAATDGAAVAERAVQTVTARLEALRLALLNEPDAVTVDDSSEVFLFVEEFKALARPLRAFAEAVFRRSPYHAPQPFRGVYFTSAAQDRAAASKIAARMGLERPPRTDERTARPFFARHLFAQILGEEGTLARRTAQWYERYHTAQLAGILATVALALAVVLVLTLSFVRNSQALGRLALDGCRPGAGQAPLGSRLDQLEDCREAIESLLSHSRWSRLSMNFGLRHTDQVQEALRDRYIEAAARDVLGPLETRIDRKLTPGPDAPVYVAALLERIDLVARCGAQGCPQDTQWSAPRYAAMLATELGDVGQPVITRLVNTEAAFLRWQRDPAALDRLRGADAERVARWIRMGGLRADWILASASSRFPAVGFKDFWGAEGPAHVDGAYTARAWNDAVRPLVVGLRRIPVHELATATTIAKFEADYRREALSQWETFLAAFSQGERFFGGRRAGRDFAIWVAAPDSPYRRVIDVAALNISAIAVDMTADVPPWTRTLQRYGTLRAKVSEMQKLSPDQQKSRLQHGEREAAAFLTSYQEAMEQLPAEVATSDKAYRSALRVFEEGEPGLRSTHPIQKALWSVRGLRGLLGSEHGDDRLFWALLLRPVDLGWRAILDQAAVHVQQQWEAVFPELAAPETPPAQRASRVIAFVNDKLGGLLDRRGDRYVPRSAFNQGVPFSGAFLDYLARARLFSPDASVRSEPPRHIVTAL